MKDLDLRQIGTILGLPLYVDVSSVIDTKSKDDVIGERSRKAMLAGTILRRGMEMSEPPEEDVERFKKAHDL